MEMTFEEMWEKINDNFEWGKVRKAMIALDWNWWLGNRDDFSTKGIPDIETIKKACYRTLKDCHQNKKEHVETGGFSHGYKEDEGLYLSFTIESCLSSECY